MRDIWLGAASGHSQSTLRWGEAAGRWRRIVKGVYGDGADDPSELDIAVAEGVRTGAEVTGRAAAMLHGFDGVWIHKRKYTVRQRALPAERITDLNGIRVTDALQTLIDIAAEVPDDAWEQALESALRKDFGLLDQLQLVLPELGAGRVPGTRRIRRVLQVRGPGPPTGSLLETMMVQLARRIPGLGRPVRQYEVRNQRGAFVAFVDLAWPELGLFIELDGQQHLGQPVYDATRETAVVAATGWLCGRFTWHEVRYLQMTTVRRLAAVAEQARRRPLPA